MSIYSDKLAHIQLVINCRYSVAHLRSSEATLSHNLGALHFDDVMSYKSLTTAIVLTIQKPNYKSKFLPSS